MTLSKKGLRTIEVGGDKYEWTIRKKPTYNQAAFQASMKLAVELANSTRFGFQFGAFTSGLANAYYLAENIKAGRVYINEATSCWDEMAPFGGVKRSGVGRMLSNWICNELSEIKMILFDLGKVKK